MTCGKNIGSLAITIIILVFLISLVTQIHGSEKVTWKVFKEKNDVFTIKYPSNWAFAKYYENSSEPINIYFYPQSRSSLAELALYAQQSLFTNSSDLVNSYPVILQNEPNYEALEPTQCGEYLIKNVSACDTIVTYKDTRLEGQPVVRHLIVGAIDERGHEYIIEYYGTEKLFDHFLPVANEMIKSFNITESGSLSGSEWEQGLPDLPALPSSQNFKEIMIVMNHY